MEWKPNRWIAALLSLFLNPLGMLYLQRPGLGLVYFLIGCLLGIATVAEAFLGRGNYPLVVLTIVGWVIALTCAIHSFRLASRAGLPLRRWYSRWFALAGLAVTTVVFVFCFRAFFYEPFRIPSASMHPTAPEGSFVFASKWGFGHYGTYGIYPFSMRATATISRGDVVIHLQQPGNLNYIRRVVAVPGDHIEYRSHRMVLNGRPVPLTNGDYDGYYQHATEMIDGQAVRVVFIPDRMSPDYDQVVPPDQYVMFGDNRDNAKDSRYLGMVRREDVMGKVVKIIGTSQ